MEGMANIRVCANNIQATLQVAVSSELKETMLISCDDLRKLRVIPADFPNAVLTVKQPNLLSSLRAKLLRLFDKTLSDDLNPEPMRCNPITISLENNSVPICVTTARRVPKHYEPESKKTIAELIDRKVIAPVDEPTTWCSPAFFVPKADGKRLRLMTDFTALNKFVSTSARTTTTQQPPPTPPGRLGTGHETTRYQQVQEGPLPSGGGTPAAPLQRAAWRTTRHPGQVRHCGTQRH